MEDYYYVITYYHYHLEYHLISSIKSFSINEDRHVVLSIINIIHTVYMYIHYYKILYVCSLHTYRYISNMSIICNITSTYMQVCHQHKKCPNKAILN